jgi:hypothetical protein
MLIAARLGSVTKFQPKRLTFNVSRRRAVGQFRRRNGAS